MKVTFVAALVFDVFFGLIVVAFVVLELRIGVDGTVAREMKHELAERRDHGHLVPTVPREILVFARVRPGFFAPDVVILIVGKDVVSSIL